MPRPSCPAAATLALALAGLLPALAPAVAPQLAAGTSLAGTGAAEAATTGSLTVTPNKYLPGQALRFRGDLGIAGVRPVHLESHMNRPGDTWGQVADSTFSTNADGSFDFRFRAPAMNNISYRVVGGGQVTNAHRFNANQQELTLTPVKTSPEYPFYRVGAGSSLDLLVDTTPAIQTAFGTPPPIPGRTVRLQERTDENTWTTIASGTTDEDGHAFFTVTSPASGTRVLRARQAPWTVGANQIGWYASFPAYFIVSGAASVHEPRTTAATPTSSASSPHRPTASQRFRWGASRWDYAWEAGQSLSSPPSKGDIRRGKWRASSDGTGRATPFNGGLVLQSKYKKVGPGDRGSTAAILRGGAQERGRWEFRLQGRPWEVGARPYRFRVELVPAGTSAGDCSPNSVVVAEFTLTEPGMRFGVQNRTVGTEWRGELPKLLLAEHPFNVAVEVGNGHITWFHDSDPIGTVKDTQAQLDVKLVPRLSLLGDQVEMNGAQVNSDWQRSWPLGTGSQVQSGPALSRTSYAGC